MARAEQALGAAVFAGRSKVTTMANLYRIEIDVFLEDWRRSKVIQAAREHYRNTSGAWTFDNGKKVKITPEEFVVDTKTAFLELAESGFRLALPDIEPHAFRCGIANTIDDHSRLPMRRIGRRRTKRPRE